MAGPGNKNAEGQNHIGGRKSSVKTWSSSDFFNDNAPLPSVQFLEPASNNQAALFRRAWKHLTTLRETRQE
jgi:hypothetical protein